MFKKTLNKYKKKSVGDKKDKSSLSSDTQNTNFSPKWRSKSRILHKKKAKIRKKSKFEANFSYKFDTFNHSNKTQTKIGSIVICSLLACFMIWMFLFTDYFKVSKFEFVNLEKISEQEAIELAKTSIKNNSSLFNKNILFVNKNNIKDQFNNAWYIQNINIDRVFPNKLKITIKEQYPVFLLIDQNNYYFINQQGTLYKQVEPNELLGTNITKLQDTSTEEKIVPGEYFTDQEMADIDKITSLLIDDYEQSIKSVEKFGKVGKVLTIHTHSNTIIKFNLGKDIDTQINYLKNYTHGDRDILNRIQSIDLTLADQIRVVE